LKKLNLLHRKIFLYKRIIFVRHGESTENIASKEGKKYDKNNIVLTENGKKQAKKTITISTL
jgi:broad specificity phosphatase PhoE